MRTAPSRARTVTSRKVLGEELLLRGSRDFAAYRRFVDEVVGRRDGPQPSRNANSYSGAVLHNDFVDTKSPIKSVL
jgi:hypothetical protein